MRGSRKLLVGALVALGALLAACGQQVANVPGGYVTLTVGLEDAIDASGIQAAGAPYSPDDGGIAVDNVQVAVFDKDGTQVEFVLSAGEYTAQVGGGVNTIELTPADASAQVNLPAAGNPYTFESKGFDAGSLNVIAYDSQDRNVIDATTVLVKLASVIDQADGAVLVPRFPTNYAMPGSTLDLMLVVMANGNADFPGSYLQVPMSDFEVSFGAVVGGAVEATSKRGIRITVDETCSEVTVAGTVSGLVADGPDIEPGDVAIQGDGTYEIACPAPFNGDITVDLEAPTVSLQYDSILNRVYGAAHDNAGIASVTVYDGPILVATTDPDQVGPDIAQVIFAPGTTNWHADLTVAPTGELTVVATDSSGNESSDTTPFPGFVYVDDDASAANADGSEARPFPTIEQGIAAVAEGGTVFVMAGEYEAAGYAIHKPLTLLGAGEGVVTIKTTGTNSWGMNVTADGVTLKAFTLVGPDAGVGGNYGIKAFRNDGLNGLTIEDVTVTNYGRSEIDLNTVAGAVLRNVTADGNDTDGVGIALSGVDDVVLQGVHTLRNNWGGLGLFSTNTGTINGVTDVDVDAASIFEDNGGNAGRAVYIDNEFDKQISGLRLEGFSYAVFAPQQRGVHSFCAEATSPGRGEDFIDLTRTLPEAVHLALTLCVPTNGSAYIRELGNDVIGAITYENVFHVGEGMSIQAAIDNAAPNATVNLTAGTFDAVFAISNANGLEISGEGAGTVLAPTAAFASGVDHKYRTNVLVAALVDHSSGVVLEDLTIDTTALQWDSDINAAVLWNASEGHIERVDFVGAGLDENGAQTGQSLAVDAGSGESTLLAVVDTDFSGWQKNGIDIVTGNGSEVAGDGGDITVHVSGGTFTGAGATDQIAQNGIVFWDRAGGNVVGTIDGVTFADIEYTGGDEAAGILAYGDPKVTPIENSTFEGSVEVYIANVTDNLIEATANNTFDAVVGSGATPGQLSAIKAKIVEQPGQVVIQAP